MRIQARYHADRAVLRLVGDVAMPTVLQLVDDLELCASYYGYERVVLQIDSGGGSAPAAALIVDRMMALQSAGLTIATHALTLAASAAALILAAGSIGERSARSSARLLVHGARLITARGTVLTREALDVHSSVLGDADAAAYSALARRVFSHNQAVTGEALEVVPLGAVGIETPVRVRDADHLARLYLDLAAQDRLITPQIALGYHLIDHITEEGHDVKHA